MIIFPTDLIVSKTRGVKNNVFCSYNLFHLDGSNPLVNSIVNTTYTYDNKSKIWSLNQANRPWYMLANNLSKEYKKLVLETVDAFEGKNGEINYCLSNLNRGKTPYVEEGLPKFVYYVINDDGVRVYIHNSRPSTIKLKPELMTLIEDHNKNYTQSELQLHHLVDYSEMFLGPKNKQKAWIEHCEKSLVFL